MPIGKGTECNDGEGTRSGDVPYEGAVPSIMFSGTYDLNDVNAFNN